MSEYLEAHRDEYYDRLLEITDQNEWHGWVTFFLQGMVEQAEANLEKVRSIRDLYEETRKSVVDLTHFQYSMAADDALFTLPIISGTAFAEAAGFDNRVTANNMLSQLEANGLITRIREGGGRMPAIYAFPRLINIAEGRPVFREVEPRLL